MKKMESKIEKQNRRDQKEEKHVHAVLYFLLGILLSASITAASIVYVVPKMVVKTERAAVSAVTSELVEDTVKASLGSYLATNKITVSDESMADIAQYITDSVNNSNQFTEDELWEVKNLIKVSVQGANENVNTNAGTTNNNISNSMTTLQEFVINGDSEISNALKEYIDNIIVPGINQSLIMNTEDIVNVNRTIVQMGNSYSSYMAENNTNLEEIIKLVEDTQDTVEDYREQLTEKVSDFRTEYDNYVKATDEQIEYVNEKLGEYVTIVEYESFKENYNGYKKDMEDTVEKLQNSIERLDEQKADKTALEELAANVSELKKSYDNFTGENGDFAALKDRVTSTETDVAQNGNDIVALQNRITELENSITQMGNANSNDMQELETRVNSTLEERFSKFYQVGSIYMTFGNENPADLYGGTWEKVEDTFLMAAGNQYPVGSTGGNNAVTIGASNIPSLNISGSTTAKNGISTSGNGAYNGTITSTGTYQGGTYGTSVDGEHWHGFPALLMGYYGGTTFNFLPNGGDANLWRASNYTTVSGTSAAGNHSHTVNIPSQTITSYGNLNIGNHSHTVNIPSLNVTGTYQNENVQSIDVTNKYVAVNVWKRVA
ncbi:MAG: hypothetical protein GX284_07660 [Clostridiales bacterium]|nr:hypothetical protein [Clostridiales bacterium]